MDLKSDLKQSLGYVGITLISLTIANIIFTQPFLIINKMFDNFFSTLPLGFMQIISSCIYTCSFIMAIIVGALLFKDGVKFLVPIQKINLTYTVHAVYLGLGVALGANSAINAISSWLSKINVDISAPSISASSTNATNVALLFISYALLPAIFEEILFRGIIMQPLRKFGNGFAIITSSICFGIAHGNFTQFFAALFVGLFFGLVTVRTGSIVTSSIIHLLYNSIGVLSSIAYTNPALIAPLNIIFLSLPLMALYAGLILRLKFGKVFWVPKQYGLHMSAGLVFTTVFTSIPVVLMLILYLYQIAQNIIIT